MGTDVNLATSHINKIPVYRFMLINAVCTIYLGQKELYMFYKIEDVTLILAYCISMPSEKSRIMHQSSKHKHSKNYAAKHLR